MTEKNPLRLTAFASSPEGGAFRHLPVSRAKPPPFGGGGFAQQRLRGFAPANVLALSGANALNSPSHRCGSDFLLAASVQGRSAGPEAGRGVPTPPSLPLDSTHPATGQGLLALDNPKEEVEAQKS